MSTFEFLASPRVIRGAPATIWLATYLDGKPEAPTSAGTVTVTGIDGATIASASATIANKRLEYTLTAAEAAQSDQLTASWANVVMGSDPAITLASSHEITGDVLFTLNQARGADEGTLRDETKYPNDTIWAARDQIWDAFEDILGYALGGRIERRGFSGDGSATLWLPRPGEATVRAIETRTVGTTTWTAFTSTELADVFANSNGSLTRESLGAWPLANQNIRITYEAGAVPIPRELKSAALRVARFQLVKNPLPERATSMNTEAGTFSLVLAGPAPRWFGLPDVDSVLARLRANLPGFA